MKNILLILGFAILFGCSKDDESPKQDPNTLICGGLTITKIEGKPNKIMVKAHGTEVESKILVTGKTFEDITCDNTLEYVGMTAE